MFPGQLPRPVKGSELAKGSCPIRYQRFAAHPSGPNVSLPDWTFARLPPVQRIVAASPDIDGGPLFSPARMCPAGIFQFISGLVKCGSGRRCVPHPEGMDVHGPDPVVIRPVPTVVTDILVEPMLPVLLTDPAGTSGSAARYSPQARLTRKRRRHPLCR